MSVPDTAVSTRPNNLLFVRSVVPADHPPIRDVHVIGVPDARRISANATTATLPSRSNRRRDPLLAIIRRARRSMTTNWPSRAPGSKNHGAVAITTKRVKAAESRAPVVLEMKDVHYVVDQKHQPGGDADHGTNPAMGLWSDDERLDGRRDDRQSHPGVEALDEGGVRVPSGAGSAGALCQGVSSTDSMLPERSARHADLPGTRTSWDRAPAVG